MNLFNISRIDRNGNINGKAFLYFLYKSLGGKGIDIHSKKYHLYCEAQTSAEFSKDDMPWIETKALQIKEYLQEMEKNISSLSFIELLDFQSSPWIKSRSELFMGDRDIVVSYDDHLRNQNLYLQIDDILSLNHEISNKYSDHVNFELYQIKNQIREKAYNREKWAVFAKDGNPILSSLIKAIQEPFNDPEFVQRFLLHIYGDYDYYAVCDNSKGRTHLTAYNLYGTLYNYKNKTIPSPETRHTERRSDSAFLLYYGDWIIDCRAATSGVYMIGSSLILKCRVIEIPKTYNRFMLPGF